MLVLGIWNSIFLLFNLFHIIKTGVVIVTCLVTIFPNNNIRDPFLQHLEKKYTVVAKKLAALIPVKFLGNIALLRDLKLILLQDLKKKVILDSCVFVLFLNEFRFI